MREGPPPRPVRVMLVEDNSQVRRAVASLLNASGDLQVCGEVATVAKAGPVAEATHPDVVIVDLRLPDGSGVDASRDARAAHPAARVLLLTSVSEDEALLASVLAGASGFLVKQLLGNDLVGSVRAVADGETLIDPAAGTAALERLQPCGEAGGADGRILALVGKGRTNRQISDELHLEEEAVRSRVASMAATLGAGRSRRNPPSPAGSARPGDVRDVRVPLPGRRVPTI